MTTLDERRKKRKDTRKTAPAKGESLSMLKNQTIYLIFVVFLLLIIGSVSYYLFMTGDDGDEGPTYYNVHLAAYIPEHGIEPAGTAQTVLVVENKGDTADYLVSFEKPDNWSAALDVGEEFSIKEGKTRVLVLTVWAPENEANGTYEIVVNISAGKNPDFYRTITYAYRLGSDSDNRLSGSGDTVKVQYTGMLTDGRVFDTSLRSVDKDPDIPKADSYGERERNDDTLDFTLGEGRMIQGFEEGSYDRHQGETFVIVVPPEKAYSSGDLAGKTLIFEVYLQELES